MFQQRLDLKYGRSEWGWCYSRGRLLAIKGKNNNRRTEINQKNARAGECVFSWDFNLCFGFRNALLKQGAWLFPAASRFKQKSNLAKWFWQILKFTRPPVRQGLTVWKQSKSQDSMSCLPATILWLSWNNSGITSGWSNYATGLMAKEMSTQQTSIKCIINFQHTHVGNTHKIESLNYAAI